MDPLHWQDYIATRQSQLRPPFAGYFRYVVSGLTYLPGFAAFDDLDDAARSALTQVLFHSIPKWPASWEHSTIGKISGRDHFVQIPSLLADLLRTLPWIHDGEDGAFITPSERWLVSATTERSQRYQFRHLRPLGPALTRSIIGSPKLLSALVALGLRVFDVEKRTSSRDLLEALIDALDEDRVDSSVRNLFLGQVRDAWAAFHPGSAREVPKAFIVLRGGHKLGVAAPKEDAPVYIPDTTRSADFGPFADLPVAYMHASDGTRLLPFLRERFGERVRALSALRLEAWSNDAPIQLPADQTRLVSTSLAWLGPFVLTIAAFGGAQQQGTRTDRFKKMLAALRSVAIERVEGLRVRLVGAPDSETHAQPAFFDAEARVILYDAGGGFLEQLAGPLQQVIDRSDLLASLRLALCKIGDDVEPELEQQSAALRSLGVLDIEFAEVRQLFTGDLGWIIERLKPAVALLAPAVSLEVLSEVESVETLVALLQPQLVGVTAAQLVEIARDARDDMELGRALFDIVGEAAQLGLWNQILAGLVPPRRAGRNTAMTQEFNDDRREAMTALRAVARHVAFVARNPQLFPKLAEELRTAKPLDDLADRFWTLPFSASMTILCAPFSAGANAASLIATISAAHDATSLVAGLEGLGLSIEPRLDPTEIHRDNVEKCRKLLEDLRAAALVYCDRQGLAPGVFLQPPEVLLLPVRKELDAGLGFLELFDEKCALELLARSLSREPAHSAFWQDVEASVSFNVVLQRLGMTTDELKTSSAIVEKVREQARKKARMIEVCGQPFDSDPTNLGALRAFLESNISDDELPLGDLRKPIPLEKVAPVKKGKTNNSRGGGGGGSRKTATEEHLRLIGLAGEIYAFRMLRKQFGEVVTPEVWVSRNSLHCYPANTTDDNLGYDFCVTSGRRTFYIEVKATAGDDDAFELGSSEVRFAVDCARRQRRYRILHIQRVLSAAPIARLLPNPFEAGSKDRFRMDEAGLRIQYHTS